MNKQVKLLVAGFAEIGEMFEQFDSLKGLEEAVAAKQKALGAVVEKTRAEKQRCDALQNQCATLEAQCAQLETEADAKAAAQLEEVEALSLAAKKEASEAIKVAKAEAKAIIERAEAGKAYLEADLAVLVAQREEEEAKLAEIRAAVAKMVQGD